MILRAIRWVYGYVLFVVRDGNIEKFINLSVRKKINFWDIGRTKNALYGKVVAKEYKKLHKISRKTGSRVKLKKKFGLPFIINRYRLRLGVFVGAFLYVSIIYVLSLYVWNIKVVGNEDISKEEILKTMYELGISSGTLKNHIDVPMAKQNAMIKLPGISWISINMSGSVAEISIKEKAKTPEIVEESKPCNIKAAYDGQIERIETYKGTCSVSVGDAVVKGQLLISGIVEDYFGSNSFVHADGKIFAKTRRKFTEEIKTCKTEQKDTGKTVNRYKIKVLGVEVPLKLWENVDDTYRLETENRNFNIFGITLPVNIYSEKWYEQVSDTKEISFEEAKNKAINNINKRFKEEFTNLQILKQNERKLEENGLKFVEIEYICIENIGIKEEILFE